MKKKKTHAGHAVPDAGRPRRDGGDARSHFATRVSTPAYLMILIRPARVPRKAASMPGSTLLAHEHVSNPGTAAGFLFGFFFVEGSLSATCRPA